MKDRATDLKSQGGSAVGGLKDQEQIGTGQTAGVDDKPAASNPATPSTASPSPTAAAPSSRSAGAELGGNASANRDGASANGNASLRSSR